MIDDLDKFMSISKELIKKESQSGLSKNISPESVLKSLDISLSNEAMDDASLFNTLKEIILNSPLSSGKLFFNQLYGARNNKAVLGDLLSVMLNNSMATYKIAGPMVQIEKEIIHKVCELIKYPETSGGTLPTGGSMSNFMSLIMARDKKDPSSQKSGINSKLICYSSEYGHYSITKNASFAGIGKDNIRYIKTDQEGKMIIKDLERNIKKDITNGFTPFFVNATIGTTVMGSIDPIQDISKICEKYKLWMHIDGAYGGSVIFSEKYKHLINGIEKSNSFCFNAHKTLGCPISTSILVVRNNKDLFNSFSNEASYLYQTNDDSLNLGQTSFECGRRNNSLKFWTLWKSIGTKGIASMVEKNYELANFASSYIKNNPDYTLYIFKDSLSICFNYKNYDPVKICTELYIQNKLMIGFGEHKSQKFIRLISINRENKKEDILNVFRIIEDFSNSQIHS